MVEQFSKWPGHGSLLSTLIEADGLVGKVAQEAALSLMLLFRHVEQQVKPCGDE